ncbi:MAG: hypothetical protein LC109_08780 [Bacteroidia bacterium]|jgi:hypothetical protein|nr:hypothetical protein [Bacteroidia bacterium]
MKCIINITLFLLILLSLSIFSVSAQPSEPGYPAALRYHLPISIMQAICIIVLLMVHSPDFVCL